MDGQVADSRNVNWRQVEWERVVKVVTYMNGQVHPMPISDPRHRFFMVFRWGGQEAQYKNGKYAGHRAIKIWTQGWTDGAICHLQDIDFYTGDLIKKYDEPITKFLGHVHPRVKQQGMLGRSGMLTRM